jgi:hypothetical protein
MTDLRPVGSTEYEKGILRALPHARARTHGDNGRFL